MKIYYSEEELSQSLRSIEEYKGSDYEFAKGINYPIHIKDIFEGLPFDHFVEFLIHHASLQPFNCRSIALSLSELAIAMFEEYGFTNTKAANLLLYMRHADGLISDESFADDLLKTRSEQRIEKGTFSWSCLNTIIEAANIHYEGPGSLTGSLNSCIRSLHQACKLHPLAGVRKTAVDHLFEKQFAEAILLNCWDNERFTRVISKQSHGLTSMIAANAVAENRQDEFTDMMGQQLLYDGKELTRKMLGEELSAVLTMLYYQMHPDKKE